MSNSQTDKDRRKVIKFALGTVVSVPLGSLLMQGRALAGEMPPVAEDDPAAKGLGYVHDASQTNDPKRKPDQFCHNCNLIRSDAGEWRACALFPGKGVNESGWCKAWVRKA